MMRLTLAIPSKGRLQEQANAFFADAGLPLKQSAGARGYRATMRGIDIDVMLLSASEIAAGLVAGDVHLGITGEDLLRETAPELESRIALLHPLGFGFANVVVAVPQAWIDVSTMADLDDVCAAFAHRHRRRLRVATKYTHLTRGFFARAGISDYRIVESAGATEGAPTAGTAEAIVDITTTGATLAANGLKVLDDGTILESQAQLAASLSADWGMGARAAAFALFSRIGARERAKASHVLRVRLDNEIRNTIARLDLRMLSESPGEAALLCPRDRLMDVISAFEGKGATVQDVEYVFDGAEPLSEKLLSALSKS
ncbi:MAG TPA: ATP phosphoribosyltransferase [Rhizomicrobium sp.]|jgi:ATP phosphoribosyltransferase|nr:ATP phosphoribosyltransferase [Rhizomicrobium sp.]